MKISLLLRRIHLYIGLLIAPSVLFFSATGALQLFSLHEAHGDYQPAPIIERLAAVHKDQRFAVKDRPKGPAPADRAADQKGASDDAHEAKPLRELLLKWTFLAVALGLIASTGMGLYIAYASPRRSTTHWALLAVGTVLPIAILFL